MLGKLLGLVGVAVFAAAVVAEVRRRERAIRRDAPAEDDGDEDSAGAEQATEDEPKAAGRDDASPEADGADGRFEGGEGGGHS